MRVGSVTRRDALLKVGAVLALALGSVFLAEAAWIHVKAGAAQLLIGAAWRRERELSLDAAPWPWADTVPIAKLTLGDGRAATQLTVLEGSSGRNLAFGPVHDAASVAPGALGNSVIEGHRDTHFKILRSAKLGDPITIEAVDGRKTLFAVTDVRIVDSRKTRILLNADVPRLTLVTCYPFDAVNPGGPLRWVVTAERLKIPTIRALRAAS